jgi:uncharacterized membrane protein
MLVLHFAIVDHFSFWFSISRGKRDRCVFQFRDFQFRHPWTHLNWSMLCNMCYPLMIGICIPDEEGAFVSVKMVSFSCVYHVAVGEAKGLFEAFQ